MSDPAAQPGAPRLAPLVLTGAAGDIEALLQEREGEAPRATALVLHPHPLYGGTLHNKVVHRVASTLFGGGAAVLRFNFRGVGRSAGAHDRGVGELADAHVAMDWLRARYPGATRWIAGFSFGSWVAARLALASPDTERLLMVAPPVHTQDFAILDAPALRKVVIQGTADDVCRPERLAPVFDRWAEPKRRIDVEGAGHFFDRQLAPLGDAVRAAFDLPA